MNHYSYIENSESGAIEQMWELYRQNPDNVDESWQDFFKGFEFALNSNHGISGLQDFNKELNVLNLIEDYRRRGHLFTQTNPVRTRRKYFPALDIENFKLTQSDLEKSFKAGVEVGLGEARLSEIIKVLKQTYCQSIGAEYLYIRNPEEVKWLQHKMESARNTPVFNVTEKLHIFNLLKTAVGFEQFIHKKFVGQKRFSLEGAESVIPALNAVIEKGAGLGIDEFVIGMAHRGRLNILANILKKPYEDIFREFAGVDYDDDIALGDVKYHLGYNNTLTLENGKKVKLNLVPNPSHLETVGPIVQGITKAKLIKHYNEDTSRLAAVVIHGDAAIAAQGVVYETIQMSQLNGYKTGGTIHVVINNQVGFTTNYLDARSSTYCTDVAKVILSPVFHVNGDDVEALIYTIQLALEYRQRFHKDVFIDILCYRKYGHNEGDEPRFTQPALYKAISRHPNPRDLYVTKLKENGDFSEEELRALENEFESILEQKLEQSKLNPKIKIKQFLKEEWLPYHSVRKNDIFKTCETQLTPELILHLAENVNQLPENKPLFSKLKKIIEDRREMIKSGKIDWALGELLAYASLIYENIPVRLSGQDSERGTFSHRHAVMVMEDSDEKHFPLKNLAEKSNMFTVFNSPLSEYGVLGFEYGYSLVYSEGLNIWEAQFGDFHNVAQVIIDQYICSAEEKWGMMNGLTLFLPHGYEGQGPEHSSGRIERFLSMCANNNMQVVVPSSPANFFHLLRRQVKREFRLPLIVFTPKSLLRNRACVSSLNELSNANFQEIIDDATTEPNDIKQIVCCYGKLYYELLEQHENMGIKDTALIRIEQLFPFPKKQLAQIMKRYKNAQRFIWAQEEPGNMGAWTFVNTNFPEFNFTLVSRPASGSPAGGLLAIHKVRQQKIFDKVFNKCQCCQKDIYCKMECVTFLSDKPILELTENKTN
jgi:2-oxoglutarate dehydrogenase E1 component